MKPRCWDSVGLIWPTWIALLSDACTMLSAVLLYPRGRCHVRKKCFAVAAADGRCPSYPASRTVPPFTIRQFRRRVSRAPGLDGGFLCVTRRNAHIGTKRSRVARRITSREMNCSRESYPSRNVLHTVAPCGRSTRTACFSRSLSPTGRFWSASPQ